MTIQQLFILIVLLKGLNSQTEDTIVVKWNKVALQAFDNIGLRPQVVFRAAAILHTSMYNAWAPFDSQALSFQSEGFSRQPESERTASNKHIAVSYAAYSALKALAPSQQSLFDELMQDLGYDIETLPTDSDTPAGIGTSAAQELLDIRLNDGSNQLGDLNPSNEPYSEPILLSGYTPYEYINTVDTLNDVNYWQPQRRNDDGTPQTYETPHWGYVTPFVLESGSQFRPAEGPKTTQDGDAFIAQAQQIYDLSQSLTEEQKVKARFWDGQFDPNYSSFNRIAHVISTRDNNDLDDDVKLFFAMNIALVDASIATFDAKRFWNSVRPITVIRNYIDPDWISFQPASAHPDFIASSVSSSAAAAEVLKNILGSDWYGGSYTNPETGITLSWETFTDAVNEGLFAFMYSGQQFEDASVVGEVVGRKVGEYVWEKIRGLFEGNA